MEMSQSAFRASPAMIAALMEGAGGVSGMEDRLTGVAWLMILEEASGTPRVMVADTLGTPLKDLDELRVYVILGTGYGDDDGEEQIQEKLAIVNPIWLAGITGIRASAMLTQQAIGMGWDQVEAIAIDKVAQHLSRMNALGDPMEMLEIASKANKAIRRSRGEGRSGNGGYGMAGVKDGSQTEASISIPTESGMMTLQLSHKVKEQIETAHGKVVDGRIEGRLGGIRALEMLDVKQTRDLLKAPESEANKDVSQDRADSFKSFIEGMKAKGVESDE